MDLKSRFEQVLFYFQNIPHYSELKAVPKGQRYYIDSHNISIGNLEWKEGWKKEFNWMTDPLFRWSKPWAQEESVKNNIIIDDDIILRKKKYKGSKDAYLFSNFTFKYGTIRALIKLPDVPGMWSAFWTFGENELPEYDILEHCGGWDDKVNVTHHWGYDYGKLSNYGKKSTLHNGRKNPGFDPTNEYYLYELEISPYKIVYRINGITVRVKRKGVSSGKNHVLFDIVRGGYCGSSNDIESERDAYMRIKYIELFKVN